MILGIVGDGVNLIGRRHTRRVRPIDDLGISRQPVSIVIRHVGRMDGAGAIQLIAVFVPACAPLRLKRRVQAPESRVALSLPNGRLREIGRGARFNAFGVAGDIPHGVINHVGSIGDGGGVRSGRQGSSPGLNARNPIKGVIDHLSSFRFHGIGPIVSRIAGHIINLRLFKGMNQTPLGVIQQMRKHAARHLLRIG